MIWASVDHEYMAKTKLLKVGWKCGLWVAFGPGVYLLEYGGVYSRSGPGSRVKPAKDRLVVDGLERERLHGIATEVDDGGGIL